MNRKRFVQEYSSVADESKQSSKQSGMCQLQDLILQLGDIILDSPTHPAFISLLTFREGHPKSAQGQFEISQMKIMKKGESVNFLGSFKLVPKLLIFFVFEIDIWSTPVQRLFCCSHRLKLSY